MRRIGQGELCKVLAAHKKWLDSGRKRGERADLENADLRGADLRGADLRGADLGGANLQGANLRYADLRGADLRGADLRGADLRGADLGGANLQGANLRYADLGGADLGGANLRGANLDFSCLPLWCGSLEVEIDARIAAQLMYHTMRAMQSVNGDADVDAVLANEDCIRLANRFHRVDESGWIEKPTAKKWSEE